MQYELNNLYVDNELNNLQAIATHERFVEGFEIVHLEEFGKFDMDLVGSEVVILWDLQHDHCSFIP